MMNLVSSKAPLEGLSWVLETSANINPNANDLKIVNMFISIYRDKFSKVDVADLENLKSQVNKWIVTTPQDKILQNAIETKISNIIDSVCDLHSKNNDYGFWVCKVNKEKTYWEKEGMRRYQVENNKPSPLYEDKEPNMQSKFNWNGIHRAWGSVYINKELASYKMIKNQLKALTERPFQNAYISYAKLKKCIKNHYPNPLKLEFGSKTDTGFRKTMEDAHFCIEMDKGTLVGVFDGHGGHEVANLAKQLFQTLFPVALLENKGNVHKSFEQVFFQIKLEILKIPQLNHKGSTAVVSFFDKKTNLVYTATLGDSEAKIYRKFEDEWKSIPLSCVRDWGSKRDETRAVLATNEEFKEPFFATLKDYWRTLPNNKERRMANKGNSFIKLVTGAINISRAFGDEANNIGRPINTVVTKSKIGVFPLLPGDVFVSACDGLWDFVHREKKIVCCIADNHEKSSNKISEELVNLSLDKQRVVRSHYPKNKGDNVTVVVLKITEDVTPEQNFTSVKLNFGSNALEFKTELV